MRTIALLTISNIFMTFAWYGHLKYREVPLYKVIVVSWMIAFFEYCFQVPANRIGSYEFTAAQLKTIQEVITLTVFAAFSVLYLKQPLRWNYLAGRRVRNRCRWREESPGIEEGIPEILIKSPVVTAAAGLGRVILDTHPLVNRRVAGGLDLELIDCIH